MARKILVIVSDEPTAAIVCESLVGSREDSFEAERVSRLWDGVERLAGQHCGEIAAVIVDLFLPDSRGMETFERLFRTSPRVPILVVTHAGQEDIASQAVKRGAQDYLLADRLDSYWLLKAVNGMLDRSARAAAQAQATERALVTLDSIGDAVMCIDGAGAVSYLNPVAERMTGWPQQEALGRPLLEVLRIIDAESREIALNPLAMAILHDRPVGMSEHCILVRRDGYESAVEDTAAPIHDQHGRVNGAVIVFHDVSAARAMSLRMSHLAQHDFLTQLPNRMLLSDRLTGAIAAASRHQRSLAVLYADVDHFKRINDSSGHAVGDQLLQSVARRLLGCVRESDTVSRQGGDEFVVLLRELDQAKDAAISAEKILAAMNAPHRIGDQDMHATLSIGIGLYPNDGTDADTLLHSADRALLLAKGRGRNNYQYCQANAQVQRMECAQGQGVRELRRAPASTIQVFSATGG